MKDIKGISGHFKVITAINILPEILTRWNGEEKKKELADGQVKSVQSQLFHINHSSLLFLLLSSLQLNIDLREFTIKYRYACVLIKKPILSLRHIHPQFIGCLMHIAQKSLNFLDLASSNLIGWLYATALLSVHLEAKYQADTTNTFEDEILTGFANVSKVIQYRMYNTLFSD